MTSRRLGLIAIALVAVWCVAGLDWQPGSSASPSASILQVSPAYAGNSLDDRRGGYSLLGDPDDFAQSPDGDPDDFANSPPDSSGSDGDGARESESLLDKIMDAIGSLFGLR